MDIKILGSGCASCSALLKTTEQVVNDLQIEATVAKESDVDKILSYRVMRLPAMVIDGKVVSAGFKLTYEQVKALVIKHQK